MEPETIEIKNAREHNLRSVSLSLPRNRLIVFTGVSGSGKSSLAFDTLYAEGQRRYIESLSSYARQFMGQMQKPDCDLISGLSPAIAIQQKTTGWNPRSTVGTVTAIYDFLRVLYARVGAQHCTSCGRKIAAQSREQIVEGILRSFGEEGARKDSRTSSADQSRDREGVGCRSGRRAPPVSDDRLLTRAALTTSADRLPTEATLILAPVARGQKGEFRDLFDDLIRAGYVRARVDGRVVELREDLALHKNQRHDIEVVIDRLNIQSAARSRLAEAVESALRLGKGTLIVAAADAAQAQEKVFSSQYACTRCSLSFEPPTPQLFSFNSPTGMCLTCDGLGELFDFDPDLLVPDPALNFWAPCIAPMRTRIGRWRRHIYEGVARAVGFDISKPWKRLPPKARDALLHGTGDRHITYEWRWSGGVWKHGDTFEGVIAELRDKYRKAKASFIRAYYEKYMRRGPCLDCHGARLNEQARAVRLPTLCKQDSKSRGLQPARPVSERKSPNGPNIQELCALSVAKAYETVSRLALTPVQKIVAEEVLKEIRARLEFLLNVGLHYLTLDRTAPTLSGGELQRIRLAGQIGSGLVGVLYILDEPSIGLHARDHRRLLDSLLKLRQMGNTVIVVEHDEETMRAADHVVDFGPGPGVRGGRIVASGTFQQVIRNKDSLTGRYLRGQREIAVPEPRRTVKETPKRRSAKTSRVLSSRRDTSSSRDPKGSAQSPNGDVYWLTVQGARHNNLKNITVDIPQGRFVCVTGVSGSGKSSLVNDIIREALSQTLNGAEKVHPGAHDAINGTQHLDKVIDIDQSPIGRTPRSNPATYVKVFDEIRRLYAKLPDSKVRGYAPGRFSFNVPTGEGGGGRCEACEGNGSNRVEMDFLADVWVPCPVCAGARFSHETLQIRYKGRHISDVLNMDVQEALKHFGAIPKVRATLMTLHDVGLDYVKLGQSSTTLSGGEAQRIKLARELAKRSTGRTLYLLDEPTTGLHFEDIRRLLAVLHGFVDAGNSVIVIEHNLDVIKTADWVIDLGPEGGAQGGYVVVAGTPEQVAACKPSHTGAVLKKVLDGRHRRSRKKGRKQPGRDRQRTNGAPIRLAKRARPGELLVVGAREHNLKDVTVSLPRGRMSVCTGVSGSGKSSFAMDTVFAEGQRRYVESLSAYARQFLGQLQKPKVDHVYGLSPAIAIEQKSASKSPRSTVGTVTEIFDYMRVLWARVGQPFCPRCGVPIGTQSSEEIVDRVMALPTGTRLMLCAPMQRGPGETWETLLERCRSQGYVRVRVDGEVRDLSSDPRLDPRRRHTLELVVDRVVIRPASRGRIADSIEHCLALGQGVLVTAETPKRQNAETLGILSSRRVPSFSRDPKGSAAPDVANNPVRRFSQHLACDVCGTSFDELTPHHFSFNARLGWCPACEGLGVQRGTSVDRVFVRPDESILSGAVAGWQYMEKRPMLRAIVVALAEAIGFDPAAPCSFLSAEHKRALLFGLGDRWIEMGGSRKRQNAGTQKRRNAETPKRRNAETSRGTRLRFQWKGFFPAIDEATKVSWEYRTRLQELAADVECQTCGGGRLQPAAAAVRLGRRKVKSKKAKGERQNDETGKTIVDVCGVSLTEAAAFFKALRLDRRQARIAGELLHEIKSRLAFLIDVGLGYLSLGRAAPTLSGGESQRIRLASQIGSGLTGVLYVLDEPTIGLHPRDNRRLIGALHKLRDLGNTLLMVEHDREVIAAADHVVDFGPGAGAGGGHVVAACSPAAIKRRRASLTGRYLGGSAAIAVPSNRREVDEEEPRASARAAWEQQEEPSTLNWLVVRGARQNNLKDIDVAFPLGRFVGVTGVSGSGKSSLVSEILHPALASRLHRARVTPGEHARIEGIDHVDKVINVDQQPIGNSPSSNPATYCGIFDLVREVFAKLPDSRMRGYTANRFSFNRPGGRCDDCEGLGEVCHEMHFLPDVWVSCETCGGTRYQRETLEVRYKGKNIADVLRMQVSDALAHFAHMPKLRRLLQTLEDVGLGYLPLGQSAPTLSGGEAQRVKLAAELGRPNTGRTVYLLDEPTTGLHFDDLRKLLNVLHRLVDLGNTVVCIEHNMDVIKTADWLIDLGPEAGDEGGFIVAAGSPETVAQVPASHTGRLLKAVLSAGPHERREVYDPAKAAAAATAKAAELPEMSAATKMPWQRDGRRWHLELRRGSDGKPAMWEGRALETVIDRIEQLGKDRLLPTDWKDRARVEIKANAPPGLARSAVPWFCHALTGGRWLLDLLFRVPGGSFNQKRLAAKLKLKTLDEREDIAAYGQASRVQIRPAIRPMDNIRVLVHDRKEVATPGFRQFLAAALTAYLDHVSSLAADASKAEPWKKDGKAWHLSQKSLPPKHPRLWKPATLVAFLGMVNKAVPDVKTLWDRKMFVEWVTGDGRRVGKTVTSNGYALRVDVNVPRGRFTPTQVEHLGTQQEFARSGSSGAELTFWFQSVDEIHSAVLKRVLQAAALPNAAESAQSPA